MAKKLLLLLWIILLLSLSTSCSALPIRQDDCRANTSRLLPGNGVPTGDRLKRAGYSGNTTEGINFLTLGSSRSAGELLDYYNRQTTEQRDDWTILDSETGLHAAWSSWQVVDECGDTWEGLIAVHIPPTVSDPFVTIRVKKAGN